MNVAGALFERIGQDQVDQLDDGGVFARSLQLIQRYFFLVFRGCFEIEIDAIPVDLGDLLVDFFQLDRVLRSVIFFQSFRDGSFGGNDRFDIKSCHELDVVHGEDVGGIDARDRESAADAAQRHNHVFLRHIHRDKLDD